MSAAAWIFAAWGTAASTAALALLAAGLRTSLTFRRVGDLRPPAPARWPSLSVIVAARDEAGSVEKAVSSLLAQDYPALEIVAVDDRSVDGTGGILDALAARDPRVRVQHVSELPDGWLGKVHALHVASRAAAGEFLLFTDGDVHFAPGALRRLVAHCEAEGVDHFAVAPLIRSPGLLQEATATAFVTAFMMGTRATEVSRPGSTAFVGVGACNLVRRSAFARTPGFEWLRMEVLDDVGLALMLHRAGARKDFAIGLEELWITWYPSLGEMARGLEKNLFAAFAHYRWGRVALAFAAAAAASAGIAIALLPSSPVPVRALGWAALAGVFVNAAVLRARTGVAVLPLLLAPLGAGILGGMMLRSAWRCTRRGGIEWRGTLYPLEELRRLQRVRL